MFRALVVPTLWRINQWPNNHASCKSSEGTLTLGSQKNFPSLKRVLWGLCGPKGHLSQQSCQISLLWTLTPKLLGRQQHTNAKEGTKGEAPLAQPYNHIPTLPLGVEIERQVAGRGNVKRQLIKPLLGIQVLLGKPRIRNRQNWSLLSYNF